MLLAPFSSDQRAELRQMIEVNLLGAITATGVFLDQLRDGGGDLINISSVAGRTARPGNAGYAATKWGLNGWSEALRWELQPDVRVIVIEPGAVARLTDHITHAETKAGAEQMYKQTSITAQARPVPGAAHVILRRRPSRARKARARLTDSRVYASCVTTDLVSR
jgi:NADP-dependent 3-hydroxy acid dehydrogenase YdfG